MLQSPHDRDIFKLALPALGGLAIDPLVSLVDTAFVGHLGTLELAALGVNASLFTFTFIIFNFLAYGTTPRVGRAYGAGDLPSAGRAVVEAFTLAVVAGVISLAGLELMATPLLTMMGAQGELMEPALEYLRIRALAGPAVLLITAGRGAFRGFQDTATPLRIALVVNLINLILDPLLIFGLGHGLSGAATATALAQWAGALLYVVMIFGREGREAMGIKAHGPSLKAMTPFLLTGARLLIRTGTLVGTMTLATAVATRMGVVEVAAHQVANQLWMFMALAIDALGVAGQSLVSAAVGAGQPRKARDIARRLLHLGFTMGVALALLFWLTRPVLPGFFSDDPTTLSTVSHLFLFVALLQPLNGLVFVWDGIFMGLEDFAFLAIAMLISALTACTIMLMALNFGWGLEGVWWGITALMVTRIITLAWRHRQPIFGAAP